jgi:hypothetical protein
MLLGRYPADILPLLEDSIQDGDMVTIRQPVDFYGVNYYNPLRVAANTDPESENPFEFLELVGYDRTDFDWPVVPDAPARVADHPARAVPRRAAADHDHRVRLLLRTGPDAEGVSTTKPRIDYLDAHLRAVATGHRPGRRRPRLLHVVADGQLRVGRGLQAALRPGARRLRDVEAHAQELLPLVRRDDPGARAHARRKTGCSRGS